MFHAHIYFPLKNIKLAEQFKERIVTERKDVLNVYDLHMGLVGPHKMPMFELNFANNDRNMIEWLDDARGDFPVLVHPVTGDDLVDHTKSAIWLGRELGVFEDKLS